MAKSFSCFFSLFTLVNILSVSTIAAQNIGKITVGSTLTAAINSKSLLSPAGDFAFGFHQYVNHTDLFLLAIWYAKIPDTIVWYAVDANKGNPVAKGSTVTVTANAGLVLTDPQGVHLWNTSSQSSGTLAVSWGFMNDTGNFILKGSSNGIVWQSFEHPTDTLLPTQTMQREGVVDSRLTETNFTRGKFQVLLQDDGNLVFNLMDLPNYLSYWQPYWAAMTYKSPNQGYQVIYDASGSMYIVAQNGTRIYDLIPNDKLVSIRNNYQRVTLSFNGLLTWYYHPRTSAQNNSVGWSKMYSLPGEENICGVGCGYNSICIYDVGALSVSCNCPPNYSLSDPNDEYGGCEPDFKPLPWEKDGLKGEDQYYLVPLTSTDFQDCEGTIGQCTEEDCKTSCLNDRFCAAITWSSDNGGLCRKKKPPLSQGVQSKDISTTAWIKVGNGTYLPDSVIPPISPPGIKQKRNAIISVLLGGSVLVNLSLLCGGILFICMKKPLRVVKRTEEYGNVHCFSYDILEEATQGFREELGRGAFGVVFKGAIRSGGSVMSIAVKKLDRISNEADREFKAEVNVIGQTHHKNLVRLVGFCKENDQRLLVYECMRNGSLADYLFGELKPSWVARIDIAQGIAKGLLYLHSECVTQIIHCDIKPQNILLDDQHNPRIADFGLAKLLVLNQTHTQTAIRGTKGYVAPEWFRNKPVTVKVDVYSYGVLLLEIISCRKCISFKSMPEEGAILTDFAFDCYLNNTLDSLVNDDMEALTDSLQLKRFVMVALWCIQEDPNLRPTMRMVVQMLEGLVEVSEPPCSTSFFTATST